MLAPLIACGRILGQPLEPMNAFGAGKIPTSLSSTSGLHAPIQRQYWTGIGWSRPHAFLKCSRSASVTRGLLANRAVGPPGAARRIM